MGLERGGADLVEAIELCGEGVELGSEVLLRGEDGLDVLVQLENHRLEQLKQALREDGRRIRNVLFNRR